MEKHIGKISQPPEFIEFDGVYFVIAILVFEIPDLQIVFDLFDFIINELGFALVAVESFVELKFRLLRYLLNLFF